MFYTADTMSTVFIRTISSSKSSSNENCPQSDLWKIASERHVVVSFLNVISQCFELHKRHSFHICCTGAEAEISEADITKSGHIKPSLSAWLYATRGKKI